MIEVKVDLRGLNDLKAAAKRAQDLEAPLRQFHLYMQAQTTKTFEKAGGPGSGVTGGRHRGVEWAPFGDRYMNRKRPSGQRVTPSSLLMQDTGRLKQSAATEVLRVTSKTLEFGTRLRYAAYQNDLRPFLFFNPDDGAFLARKVGEYLNTPPKRKKP